MQPAAHTDVPPRDHDFDQKEEWGELSPAVLPGICTGKTHPHKSQSPKPVPSSLFSQRTRDSSSSGWCNAEPWQGFSRLGLAQLPQMIHGNKVITCPGPGPDHWGSLQTRAGSVTLCTQMQFTWATGNAGLFRYWGTKNCQPKYSHTLFFVLQALGRRSVVCLM